MPRQIPSIEDECFDVSELELELSQALEDDRKYKLIDTMKKKAIHVAANYEEFKNLVACADMKPITQKELQSLSQMPQSRSLNLSYKESMSTSRKGDSSQELQTQFLHDEIPQTSSEFVSVWRRSLKTPDEKLKYLRLTTAEHFAKLFRTDVDAELVEDIIDVLSKTCEIPSSDQVSTTHFAASVLSAISCVNRFSLMLRFLDSKSLEQVRTLLDTAERCLVRDSGDCDPQMSPTAEEITELRVSYHKKVAWAK